MRDKSKKPDQNLSHENDYWRRYCRLTILDKVRNIDIRDRTEIHVDIAETIEAKRVKWQ